MLALRIEEGVVLPPEERLVGVHPAAVDPLDRLRHERRQEAEPVGHVADDELEGGEIVGGGERVGVPEVDLVLPGGDLVVRRLHLEPHLHQLLDDDPADLLALVDRAQVEVGPGVVGHRGGRAVRALLEQEELGLAARHHREAELPGPLDLALERGARAAGERLLVRRVDVAEQPPDPAAFVVVGQDPEGRRGRA